MKKKLLLLINGLTNSGAEHDLFDFLRYLDYNKYDTTLLILKGPDDLKDLVPKEVKILYLYKENPYFDNRFGFNYIIKDKKYNLICPYILLKLLGLFNTKFANHTSISIRKKAFDLEEEFDIVIAFEYVTMKFMIKKTKGKKKIVRHNYGDIVVSKKNIELFEKCDNVIALTPLLKEILSEKFLIPKEKISIVSSNFDNDDIIKKANEFIPEFKSKFNFTSVGRITQLKRFDLMIDVMKILKDNGYDFTCHIVGGTCKNKDNEEYFEKIKDQVKNLGLEKQIDFVGEMLNPFPYVKNADIYLQASDFEAASRSVIEALILGIPCMSTETIGGKALIREGENGELSPVDNVDIFAQKLEYMIKNIDKYSHKPELIDNNKIMENYYKIFGE